MTQEEDEFDVFDDELPHTFDISIRLDNVVDKNLPALAQSLFETIRERAEDERNRKIYAAWRICEKAALALRKAAEELYATRGVESKPNSWW